MAKKHRAWTETLDQILDSFGVRPRTSAPTKREEGQLRLYVRELDGDLILVGAVRREGAELVFEYDDSYVTRPDARPISAFPELGTVYRSHRLWPFFTVRMPPLDRQDVEVLEAVQRLDASDDLELLGACFLRLM